MVWLKAIHISALIVWCAGLLSLPGLLAAHHRIKGDWTFRRLRGMTRFSYIAVASPAAVIAIASGMGLIAFTDISGGWFPLKLSAVALMAVFHVYCGHLRRVLHETPDALPGWLYRILPAAPLLLIPYVLWLVLARPI
jgi:protoporphyrinogen IX oxidase